MGWEWIVGEEYGLGQPGTGQEFNVLVDEEGWWGPWGLMWINFLRADGEYEWRYFCPETGRTVGRPARPAGNG